MGISIKYKAKIEEKDKAKITEIINFVERETKKQSLESYRYVDKGRYELMRLYDTDHKLTHTWWHFNSNDKSDKPDTKESYKTEQVGIFVNYPTSESFGVSFTYNKIDKTYDWDDSTKTQVFNDKEIGNIGFHVWIINVLLGIKEKFDIDLEIKDEGDYYFTEKQRQEHIDYLSNRYKKHSCYSKDVDMKYVERWRKMKPFDIKNLVVAMGETLAVIENLGGLLQKAGWDEKQIAKCFTFYGNKKTITIDNNSKKEIK